MSNRVRCHCPRCTIRALLGPAVVITIGVLFLLQQTRGGYFDFGNTYPVILVVIGVILLASSLAPMEGHIVYDNGNVPPPPPAPGSPTQGSFPGQGQ
jgi:Domain of unknown function (DUF5668)